MVGLCNICGGTKFESGPRGRPGPDGGPPRCVNCGSLERHRALRRAFMLIPPPMLAWRRALQFVPDDRKAFSELLRVGSDDLILHITFNSGLVGEESSHSDEPGGEYGHYHDYGRDFEQRFETAERGLSILIVEMPDPVTGDATYPFSFLCRRRNDAETLAAAFEAEPAASVESFTPVRG